MELLELYQETGEKRFLEAAKVGAQIFSSYCAMSPKVPEGDVTLHMNRYKTNTATVPAWRVAQIGLMPEAADTYYQNEAIFLAHYSAFFLRMADLSGDSFFRDIARNAIVGRYANIPATLSMPSSQPSMSLPTTQQRRRRGTFATANFILIISGRISPS